MSKRKESDGDGLMHNMFMSSVGRRRRSPMCSRFWYTPSAVVEAPGAPVTCLLCLTTYFYEENNEVVHALLRSGAQGSVDND